MSAEPDGSLTLCDFLSECALDLQTEGLRPLRHYLDRYPLYPEEVARDYLALADGGDHATPAAEVQRIGPYEVVRELGAGGQGRVLLARHRTLGRFVALKVLAEHVAASPTRRARFEREVRLAIELEHPFLCRLLEADLDHVPPFAAMEYVPGHTLAQLFVGTASAEQHHGVCRPHGARQRRVFLDYFAHVARAVDSMHRRGVVHRDLKPANLMLTPAGEPRVLDFGIACPLEQIGTLTMTDAVIGTLAYMAPEQLTVRGDVGAASDQFALAAIMIEAATGERPFAGSDPTSRLAAIAAGVPQRLLRQLEPDLRAILQRALSYEAAARYPSATAFAADLRRLRDHRPVSARRVRVLGTSLRWLRRHPALALWVTLVVLLAATTAVAAVVANESFASARQRERTTAESVATLAPFGAARGRATYTAATRLREVADLGTSTAPLVLLHLRNGDVEAAVRELRAGDATVDRATRFACFAAAGDRAAMERLLADAATPAALIQGVAAVAGQLYRAQQWPVFDVMLERSLAVLAARGHVAPSVRRPLLTWRLQSRAMRRAYGQMLFDHAQEQRLRIVSFGPDSAELCDCREWFLVHALECVQDTGPLEVLRAMLQANVVRLQRADLHPLARLRLEAATIGHALHRHEADRSRLEGIRAALLRDLPADDPAVLRVTWFLARAMASHDAARAFELLSDTMATAHAEAEDPGLWAQALFDLGLCDPDAARSAARLGEAARRHVALWGPGDARSLLVLLHERLAADHCPELDVWLQDGLRSAQVAADPDLRARVCLRRLQLAERDADPLRTEDLAFTVMNDELPFDWHVQRVARTSLVSSWLDDHEHLTGDELLARFDAAIATWQLRIANPERAALLPARMLSALGTAATWRGWHDDADLALRRAVLAAADTAESPDRPNVEGSATDALRAAADLPLTEDWTRALLGDWADVCSRFGRSEDELVLRRLAATEPPWWSHWIGLTPAFAHSLEQLAECLARNGHCDEAEACLLRRLRLHGPTDEWSTPARRQLADLYESTDRPELADDLRGGPR